MVVVMMLGQPSRLRVVIATLLSMTRMESHDNDQHDSVDEDDDGDAQVMMIMMLNMIRILLPILVLDARMTMPTSDRIQRCSCTARCSRCYNQGTTLPVRCCFILRDCRVTLDCRACGRCRSIWGIGRAGGCRQDGCVK